MKHIGIVACSSEGTALCYQTMYREPLKTGQIYFENLVEPAELPKK